jgi:hypothetical protein
MDPDSALLQTVASIMVDDDTLARHAQLRQCWTDMEAKGYRHPQDTRGLGYEASPQQPKAKPVDRAKQPLVHQWQSFVAATVPPPILPLPSAPSVMVAAVECQGPATVMSPPSVAVVQQLASPKIIETSFEEYPRHCLYVRDLVLCRTNGEVSYLIDSALTVKHYARAHRRRTVGGDHLLLDTLPNDV